jgi:hypothetical protein
LSLGRVFFAEHVSLPVANVFTLLPIRNRRACFCVLQSVLQSAVKDSDKKTFGHSTRTNHM